MRKAVNRLSGAFECDFDDLVESLPQPVNLGRFEPPTTAVSCFVGIAGFEARCFTGAETLAMLGWGAQAAICVHYIQENMTESNEFYTNNLYAACRHLCQGREPEAVTHNEHNLARDFGDRLLDAIHRMGIDTSSSATHVVFDITVGSSRLLLEGLHALLNTDVELTLVYSEAAEYRPSYDEYLRDQKNIIDVGKPGRDFLTSGVDRVELLHRLMVRSADARSTYLIAVPSFTPTRISAVLEEMAPSLVHWLFGIPHLIPNRWRLDAQRDYHRAFIEPSHQQSYVSTFDYREMLNILEKTYGEKRVDHNLLVCSLGSKLQKVGQVLFHILRPEVGAIASIAHQWDPERSKVTRACYALRFGPCSQLRRALWRTRTYRL